MQAGRRRWQLDLANELAGEDGDSDASELSRTERGSRGPLGARAVPPRDGGLGDVGSAVASATDDPTASASSSSRPAAVVQKAEVEAEDEEEDARNGKAFAWMDSGDELEPEDGEGDGECADGAQRRRSRSRSRSARRSGDEAATEISIFSDFVRHSEALVAKIPSMAAGDLVPLLTTAARAKYYDGDLLAEMWRALRSMLPRGELALDQIMEMAEALRELNAYDHGVFRAACQAIIPLIASMSREQRLRWIDIISSLNHKGDDACISLLKSLPGIAKEKREQGSDGRLPCRHFLKGFCWLGKGCGFSHEPGLQMPAHLSGGTTVLNAHQAKQGDTYRAVGGVKVVLR